MLEISQIFTYIAALAIAAAIPGPGMTALVARSISSGALTGFAMLGGLILGDLTYLSFAVFGLAVLAKSFSFLFILVKWGAVAYLCYLAWQFWSADHQSLKNTNTPKRKDLFSAGLSGYTITLGNPKTIAFYLALLPVIINLEMITIQSWAFVLIPLTTVVLCRCSFYFRRYCRSPYIIKQKSSKVTASWRRYDYGYCSWYDGSKRITIIDHCD